MLVLRIGVFIKKITLYSLEIVECLLAIMGVTFLQFNTYLTTEHNVLRRNPPDVGVTSRQKPCTKIIYIVLQTSVGLFQLSSQNNSFLATPNVKNEC